MYLTSFTHLLRSHKVIISQVMAISNAKMAMIYSFFLTCYKMCENSVMEKKGERSIYLCKSDDCRGKCGLPCPRGGAVQSI